jgi:hypothetical protein
MNYDYHPPLPAALIKKTTSPAFKNPFTFVSQLDIPGDDDGSYPKAFEESDLAWKWSSAGPQSAYVSTKFIFSCSTKGKLEHPFYQH